jgi:hypothetical protein
MVITSVRGFLLTLHSDISYDAHKGGFVYENIQ